MARNCRNRETRDRIREGKKLEYRRNEQRIGNNRYDNLYGDGDLIVLD